MAAPGQRAAACRAIANERAYSPMPKAPDTGTNNRRGAPSIKGREPAVEHQQIPRPPKLDIAESLSWTADWYRAFAEGENMLAFSEAQLAQYEVR